MFSCNVTLLNHNLVNERLLIVRNWGNYTMNELIYKAVFQSFFEVLVKSMGFGSGFFARYNFNHLLAQLRSIEAFWRNAFYEKVITLLWVCLFSRFNFSFSHALHITSHRSSR